MAQHTPCATRRAKWLEVQGTVDHAFLKLLTSAISRSHENTSSIRTCSPALPQWDCGALGRCCAAAFIARVAGTVAPTDTIPHTATLVAGRPLVLPAAGPLGPILDRGAPRGPLGAPPALVLVGRAPLTAPGGRLSRVAARPYFAARKEMGLHLPHVASPCQDMWLKQLRAPIRLRPAG